MKELELTLLVRNNLLKERREKLGLGRCELARRIGVPPSDYCDLERLKISPRKAIMQFLCRAPGCKRTAGLSRICKDHGFASDAEKEAWRAAYVAPPKKYGQEWTTAALRIAKFWRCLPEDLFPEAVTRIQEPEHVRRIDARDAPALLAEGSRALALPPDVALDHRELQAAIKETLEGLSQSEADVIRKRFGLDGEDEHVLREIAVERDRDPERIRQIEVMALRRLRHPSFSKILRDWR